MFKVALQPHWTLQRADGATLAPRVVDLLLLVSEQGSLAAACSGCGLSYRHAWQLLREAEALFGQPLLQMARGRGSSLTPLAERLVWAERRVQARLSPLLDTLASELEAELAKAVTPRPAQLRIQASHGFAVQALKEALDGAGIPHELRYCGAAEALESLAQGRCDLAGLHIPIGEFEAEARAHYRRWMDPERHRAIHLATRRQGLMTAAGNPRKVYGVADLARPGVRFINRQAGSGTRFLLDALLARAGVGPGQVQGYEQCEYTHAAVAAFVASGMADVGMGVEVPARRFGLDFVPLLSERYFLMGDAQRLDADDLRSMLAVMRSPAFQAAVDALPGYSAAGCGAVDRVEA